MTIHRRQLLLALPLLALTACTPPPKESGLYDPVLDRMNTPSAPSSNPWVNAITNNPADTYSVLRVIDGDTFVLGAQKNLPEVTVRLIGINTAEIGRDENKNIVEATSECSALDAKAHLESLILGKSVSVSFDPRADKVDRYNRLLLYVSVGTIDVAETMAADGYAVAYYPKSAREPERYSLYRNRALGALADGTGGFAHCKSVDSSGLLTVENSKFVPKD